MDVRGHGRGARNGRGCARSHYRDITQYGKRSRTSLREPYLAAVVLPWSRTLELPAPPRARPAGATPAARKALASKRRSCATETRETATKAQGASLKCVKEQQARESAVWLYCTRRCHERLRGRCEEHASSRRKGPRAQATETLPPFCKRFLQCRCCCGMCARQRPAACAVRAARGWVHLHVGAPEAAARPFFVAAFALARIFF